MTEAVPDDVMKRAAIVATNVNAAPFWDRTTIIARALMEERAAERERCAKKCEGDFSYGDWFAREIRGQP